MRIKTIIISYHSNTISNNYMDYYFDELSATYFVLSIISTYQLSQEMVWVNGLQCTYRKWVKKASSL